MYHPKNNNIEITPTAIDNQHINSNIPSANIQHKNSKIPSVDINFNIPNNEKNNIPSNIVESLSRNAKVNIFLNKKHHKSTDSSIVNVSSQKNNIEEKHTVIDYHYKNSNLPSDNIIIPSSELQLPPYKPNEYYSFDNDPTERKITLKIFSENNKESRNLTLHKITWK